MVEVLLATYNGERFLREQIESILAQDDLNIHILARDDGSSDRTPAILSVYAAKHPDRFRIITGPPTGSAKKNFAALMQQATADYICFADQDDIWLPQKVRLSLVALQSLEAQATLTTPLLIFSDLHVVDEHLNSIHPSMWHYAKINPSAALHLERLLGQSVVTGCTMMINRPMLSLARHMPEEATMHDRWIALLAAAMGKAAFLREPLVLYRQHGNNVLGAVAPDTSIAATVHRTQHAEGRRLERIRCEQMAEALLRIHGTTMPPKSAAVLRAYLHSGKSASAFSRVTTTLRHGFFRASFTQTLALLADLTRSR